MIKRPVIRTIVAALFLTQAWAGAVPQDGFITYHQDPGASGSNSWPDAALAESFEKYWTAFRDGRQTDCYNAEAPHFRFLFSEARYGAYWTVATKLALQRVDIMPPKSKTPYFVEVPLWLIKKDAQGQTVRVGMKDRWVKVSGRWYHLIQDPIVFPGS